MNAFTSALVIVGLLAANGFFVAAEFALLAARRSRLEQLAADGNRRARQALAGVRQLSLMLAGAQLGITICSLLLGAVAEPAIAHLIEDAIHRVVDLPDAVLHGIGFTIALGLIVFLHIVVGEMAPKSLAIAHPERTALALAAPFRGFVVLLRPIIGVLNVSANAVLRLCRVEPQEELALAHSPAELLLLFAESADHGHLDADEHLILTRSLELSGLTAADAMTPQAEIVAVAREATAEDIADVADRTRYSRILTYAGDPRRIIGVVHAKDVLLLEPERRATTTAVALARPVATTHAGHALENLIVEMRSGRQHLTVITDDDGRCIGVLTLEDVLDQLVGDRGDPATAS